MVEKEVGGFIVRFRLQIYQYGIGSYDIVQTADCRENKKRFVQTPAVESACSLPPDTLSSASAATYSKSFSDGSFPQSVCSLSSS